MVVDGSLGVLRVDVNRLGSSLVVDADPDAVVVVVDDLDVVGVTLPFLPVSRVTLVGGLVIECSVVDFNGMRLDCPWGAPYIA